MNLLSPLDRDFSVKGLRLHVLDWGGEGRTPLLLLHGFTGHAHAWDTLSIALQPHFHVYAMDQRGHGDSDPAEVYSPIASFDDIGGVIDQLGLSSLVVVGLSMGGRNAIYFTSKRPEVVQKLVIVDIGPEISKRAAAAPAGPPEPATWDSIEQAAQHLYRGNPYPGIHYYRWVAASSLRQNADGDREIFRATVVVALAAEGVPTTSTQIQRIVARRSSISVSGLLALRSASEDPPARRRTEAPTMLQCASFY